MVQDDQGERRYRAVQFSEAIQKVRYRMNRRKRVSVRRMSNELDISRASIRRIPKEDLGCHLHKKTHRTGLI